MTTLFNKTLSAEVQYADIISNDLVDLLGDVDFFPVLDENGDETEFLSSSPSLLVEKKTRVVMHKSLAEDLYSKSIGVKFALKSGEKIGQYVHIVVFERAKPVFTLRRQ